MGYATKRFAKRLKQIRETAGLTQEQFAKELKVSRGTISYYEKGERTPDIEFLDSLYDYFQCTLPFDFLLGNTDNIKEEHRNMYDFYGLTDEACDMLDRHPELGHIISAILSHKNFFPIFLAYEYTVQQYKSLNSCEWGYIAYLITDCLNKIIYDSLIILCSLSLTEQERVQMELRFKESEAKFDELERMWKQQKEDDKKHWAEIEKTLVEKIEQEDVVRNSAIDKIHQRFFDITTYLEDDRR